MDVTSKLRRVNIRAHVCPGSRGVTRERGRIKRSETPERVTDFEGCLGSYSGLRMMALRVGYDTPALLASSVRLQPRPAQARPTFSGSSDTKKPPGVTFASEMSS